jgi:hypothetical protein
MLTILPLASRLHPPDQVHATVTRLAARLGARGISHAIVEPGFQAPSAPLVLTGGLAWSWLLAGGVGTAAGA